MTTTRRGSTRFSSPGARASGRGRFARSRRVALAALVSLPAVSTSIAQEPTRGVGVYPGDPAESFAPALVPDTTTYRNLALRRPAYHSSSRDYNLTAQLVTDGIPAAGAPRWLSTASSQRGTLPRPEREYPVDHNSTSTLDLDGPRAWVQLELGGGAAPPRVDRILLEVRPRREPGASPSPFPMPGDGAPGEWAFAVSASDDGRAWKEVGHASGHLEPPPPLPRLGDWAGFETWFRAANPRLKPEIALDAAAPEPLLPRRPALDRR